MSDNHASHVHSHSHGHSHTHAPKKFDRAFIVGIALNLGFVAVEAVYGLIAGSMALLADAGHNLSDVLGLGLAWGAGVLARRIPTRRHTYGLRSSTILAALLNALLLTIAIGGIAWEAVRRFGAPEQVAGGTVAWVAGIGVLVNAATAWMFLSGRKNDLNVRGAFLHMAADALVSVGVVVAGVAISATGLLWIDPLVSLLIVAVIGIGTWGLLKDSVNLALDAVPEGIDPRAVEDYLIALPGVTEVHDLHIWGMSTTETALTVHLVKPDPTGDDDLLGRVCHDLHDRFGIEHSTIQWERGDGEGECGLAPADVV